MPVYNRKEQQYKKAKKGDSYLNLGGDLKSAQNLGRLNQWKKVRPGAAIRYPYSYSNPSHLTQNQRGNWYNPGYNVNQRGRGYNRGGSVWTRWNTPHLLNYVGQAINPPANNTYTGASDRARGNARRAQPVTTPNRSPLPYYGPGSPGQLLQPTTEPTYTSIVGYLLSNGIRPIVIPINDPLVQSGEITAQDMADLGYKQDEWGNYMRLDPEAPPASSGGGYGGGYSGGGYGGGYRGGGGRGRGGGDNGGFEPSYGNYGYTGPASQNLIMRGGAPAKAGYSPAYSGLISWRI